MDTFLEAIWFSKKRKALLFLLLQGPKTAEEIETALSISWKSMLLPIKELKEMDLLIVDNNKYKLSIIGKLLAKNAKSISDIIDVLDNNIDYWETRNFEVIPNFLLIKIGNLKNYHIIEPDLDGMFEISPNITESLKKSTKMMLVLSFFHPSYFLIFRNLASEGTKISFVLAKGVLDRIKTDFVSDLNNLRQNKNIELFVYQDQLLPPNIILSDSILILSIFNKKNIYDHKDILSFDIQSFKWAEELFLHYISYSKKLE